MIRFLTISSFRNRLSSLVKIKRGVYGGVSEEIRKEFLDKPIEQIRQNRDMILCESNLIIIKLRLPDKKQRLSRRDGYRLIYMVSKTSETVVFLDIYPKNGPAQQLDITQQEIARLLHQFADEGRAQTLLPFEM